MTWLPLLLADPSPLLRLRVLRELLQRPEDDPEVQELEQLSASDPLAERLIARQQPDGSWPGGFGDDTAAGTYLMATALAMMRLGYLGLDARHPAVQRGAEYLFAWQRPDGAWPLPQDAVTEHGREPLDWMPMQAALPLRALAACGYALDARAANAYRWLLDHRLEDGAWPTGMASGTLRFVGGYRKMPHSRWGCRSNTTGVLICLALHPTLRMGSEARRALDLLLIRQTREAATFGYETARMLGAEPAHGFLTFYARFDLALILWLCSRVGANLHDERVAGLAAFARSLRGAYGLWEYPARPQVARWLSVDLLQALAVLQQAPGDWHSEEPVTPFQGYPRQRKRF